MKTKLDKRKKRPKLVYTAAFLTELEPYWQANPKLTIKQIADHFKVKENGLLWAVNYDDDYRKMYEKVLGLREAVLDEILWNTAINPPKEDEFPVNATRAQIHFKGILNRTKAGRLAVEVNSAGPMSCTVKYADNPDDLVEINENGE